MNFLNLSKQEIRTGNRGVSSFCVGLFISNKEVDNILHLARKRLKHVQSDGDGKTCRSLFWKHHVPSMIILRIPSNPRHSAKSNRVRRIHVPFRSHGMSVARWIHPASPGKKNRYTFAYSSWATTNPRYITNANVIARPQERPFLSPVPIITSSLVPAGG